MVPSHVPRSRLTVAAARRARAPLAVGLVAVLLAASLAPPAVSAGFSPESVRAAGERLAELGLVPKANLDRPDFIAGTVTRAEVAALLVKAVGRGEDAVTLTKFGVKPYEDVKGPGHWAAGHVAIAKDAGFLGTPQATTFEPNRQMTGAETITVLNRFLDHAGADVEVDQRANWQTANFDEARRLGYVTGDDDPQSYANAPVTRGFLFYYAEKAFTLVPVKDQKSVVQTYLDSQPPVLTVTAPPESTDASSVTLTGTVEGARTLTVGRTPAQFDASGAWTATAPLAEGKNVILLTAWDASGNKAQKQVTVRRVVPAPPAPLIDLTLDAADVDSIFAPIFANGQVRSALGPGERWVRVDVPSARGAPASFTLHVANGEVDATAGWTAARTPDLRVTVSESLALSVVNGFDPSNVRLLALKVENGRIGIGLATDDPALAAKLGTLRTDEAQERIGGRFPQENDRVTARNGESGTLSVVTQSPTRFAVDLGGTQYLVNRWGAPYAYLAFASGDLKDAAARSGVELTGSANALARAIEAPSPYVRATKAIQAFGMTTGASAGGYDAATLAQVRAHVEARANVMEYSQWDCATFRSWNDVPAEKTWVYGWRMASPPLPADVGMLVAEYGKALVRAEKTACGGDAK